MKKYLHISLIFVFVLFLLCGCGRNDITLTVNDDGTIDAEIVYGIDKSMVAGEEVLNQVADLIKTPLDKSNIKYTESDDESFHRISVKKSFKNAAAIADAANWQGIPFVPQFSPDNADNAIRVTAENGTINFSANLNSDSFNATQILTDNKKAFGASITIIAKDGKANIDESGKSTYRWEGTAEDTIKMELSAKYNGGDLLPTENSPESKPDVPEKEQSSSNAPQSNEKEKNESLSEENRIEPPYIPVVISIIIVIALIILALIKMKKPILQSDTSESRSEEISGTQNDSVPTENYIPEKGNDNDEN